MNPVWVHEWMNEWIEWINENQVFNPLTAKNAWVLMNAWMNEWMNAWMDENQVFNP